MMLETFLPELKALGQLIVAAILGGIVGWERETAGKGAGFRTHMLICVAAMTFVTAAQFLMIHAENAGYSSIVQADPIRVIEAIVTGIAFIGAGTVFRDPDRNIAKGLTTAGSLLAVAPIGIAVALDRYVLACGVTVIVYIILRVLHRWEPRTHGGAPSAPRMEQAMPGGGGPGGQGGPGGHGQQGRQYPRRRRGGPRRPPEGQ